MEQGKIYQSISGFYDVHVNGDVYRTRARGNFRKKNIKPIVGDNVEFDVTNGDEGYILKVLPRTNKLIRPPIANTDQAIVVASAVEPDFSFILLDKELVSLEKQHIEPVIYFSKLDLLEDEKQVQFFAKIASDYQKIGYPVIFGNHPNSTDEIRQLLPNTQSVIMGQTGSGKSTLLNKVDPALHIKTAEVSKTLSRGKHTTRVVSLLSINGGTIADTPGFSSFDALDFNANELKNYFPEFVKAAANCKFRGCLHLKEPGCAVKEDVKDGKIMKSRYDDYLSQYQALKSQKPVYNRKGINYD